MPTNRTELGPVFDVPNPGVEAGNSLSDYEVVFELVQTAVADLIDVYAGEKTDEQVGKELVILSVRIARALLGQDDRYVAEPGWNVPGVIDKRVGEMLGVTGSSPESTMQTAVLRMFSDFMDLMEFVTSNGNHHGRSC
jgi:hypothetical protein